MPYQNLPNGQYTQYQLDSKYLALIPNTNKTLDATTKVGYNTDRTEKSHNQIQVNSNSESSSDSDDSNNNSDSSSMDSDAEKNEKENGNKRVVKPFRINLNKVSIDMIKPDRPSFFINVIFRIILTRGKSHYSQRSRQQA